jgi:lysozyme
LRRHFGEEGVFRDVHDIQLGSNFREDLAREIAKCDVFLAVVGRDYLDKRRIKAPDDFVRIELEAALRQRVSIVPILVGNATLPKRRTLPHAIASLVDLQATAISSGRDFDDNVRYLIGQIEKAQKATADRRANPEVVQPDPFFFPAADPALAKAAQQARRRWLALGVVAVGVAVAALGVGRRGEVPPAKAAVAEESLDGTRWTLTRPDGAPGGQTIEIRRKWRHAEPETYIGQLADAGKRISELKSAYQRMQVLYLVKADGGKHYDGTFQDIDSSGAIVARRVRVVRKDGRLTWDLDASQWERAADGSDRITEGGELPPQAYTPDPDRVLPKEALVRGVDVSHYDGRVNWPKLAADGIRFVFIKATEGLKIDHNFANNWAEAGQAGLVRGAYHFFRSDVDPTEQAQFFLNTVDLQPGDLPAALDLEAAPREGLANPADLEFGMVKWLATVEAKLGRKPIFYGHKLVKEFYPGLSALSRYPLWTSQYNSTSESPNFPKNWNVWTFWQWSDGRTTDADSLKMDRDFFNGRDADFDTFLGIPAPPQATATQR